MEKRYALQFMAAMVVVSLGVAAHASETSDDLAALLGRPADVASSAYQYRADRGPAQNPPESWILLIQYAGLPYDKPPDVNAPAVKQTLCGLLWEEVRPVRRLELTWSGEAVNIPPPDQFRNMLVMEDGEILWLARATPRAWLEQGQRIAVRNAPTHFGPVAYTIVSDADRSWIAATVEMPTRQPPKSVLLRFRHPQARPMKSVHVNGQPWTDFDKDQEVVRLTGVAGKIAVRAVY